MAGNSIIENNKKILLLFGEGDFCFSKTLITLNKFQDYDIIATEYRQEKELTYPKFKENIGNVKASKNFHILFGVDINACDWSDIYTRAFGKSKSEISEVDIIQFNFPWYFRDGTTIGFSSTKSLVDNFFEFGRINLKPGGELKLAINNDIKYYKEYGIEDYKNIDGFEFIKEENFYGTFPGYKHVSSMPDRTITDISKKGILITYSRKINRV